MRCRLPISRGQVSARPSHPSAARASPPQIRIGHRTSSVERIHSAILRQSARRLVTARALTTRLRSLLPVLLPVSLFVAHVSVFWRWIVDDAGIVFAVARNVAHGQGIVCQVGGERIEAVSSLPWMSLMASAFGLGIFDLGWTPKVVSVALVVVSYGVIYLSLGETVPWGKRVALVGLCWLSLQTGFVVWSASGLENPLYVFELSVLLACALKDLRTRSDGGCPGTIGVVAGIVGVTRPEGVVFVLVYPVWRILARVSNAEATGVEVMRDTARYVIGFGSVISAFVLFRWSYFGELLPNPYYAKGGPSWRTLEDLMVFRDPMPAKLFGLTEALGGGGAGGSLVSSVPSRYGVGCVGSWTRFTACLELSWRVLRLRTCCCLATGWVNTDMPRHSLFSRISMGVGCCGRFPAVSREARRAEWSRFWSWRSSSL